jgi:hypothetical protein
MKQPHVDTVLTQFTHLEAVFCAVSVTRTLYLQREQQLPARLQKSALASLYKNEELIKAG